MRRSRTPWLRGALTLGLVGLLGAGLLVSNVGAVPEGKEASKKFVRRQINRLRNQIPTQVTQAGNPVFIEEDELVRFFGQLDQGTGPATQTLATIGPFTITGVCDDSNGTFDALLNITTSENNSILDSNEDDDTDFDTGDTNTLLSYTGATDGGSPDVWNGGGIFHASAPSGVAIQGPVTIHVNYDGNDCTFYGTVSRIG